MLLETNLFGTTDKVQKAIDRLRAFEPSDGYLLGFSGGKDSQVAYHLAKEAGVKFKAHYHLTTVDPPELVYFIRDHYPDVIVDRPALSMWQLIEKKMTMPTRLIRYCCSHARAYFARVGTELTTNFARLDAKLVPVTGPEKLRVLHDFFQPDTEFSCDGAFRKKRPADFDIRDYVAPQSFAFQRDCFRYGTRNNAQRFGRALFLKDYAAYIKDRFLADLTDRGRNLVLSIDIVPVPTDEAVKEVEKRRLGIETNIANFQRKQNINGNFSAVLPYKMELQRKEAQEFQDDLISRDQRMFFANLTLVHTADSLDELNNDTEAILTTGRKHTCQLTTLRWQQLDGLMTALPIGVRHLSALRTLTTESLAVLMPFWVQEIQDRGGVYFGENAISRSLILCNKAQLQNPNAFLLGVPGSGKSFSAKELIVFLALATQDDILICDPEREYAALIEAMGGEVIRIAAGSKDHINALDMVEGYTDETDPLIEKIVLP